MDERKCISFQQFSFQIRGHKAQMGNEHWSVTVKQSKITRLFIFPISKITTAYFFLCSQNSKTYLRPEQITTFRKQKQSVTAFSSTTETTHLVHSLCFLLLQQIVCSYSHHSPTVSFGLWPSYLLTFSRNSYLSLSKSSSVSPMDVALAHTPSLVSSATESTFLYIDYSILLSLSYLIFFPQCIPVRILFPLNCYWDYNCQGYQRSPSNQIQQSYRSLLFSFLTSEEYSIPPSVLKHLLLLPHTVIASDPHDAEFIFF